MRPGILTGFGILILLTATAWQQLALNTMEKDLAQQQVALAAYQQQDYLAAGEALRKIRAQATEDHDTTPRQLSEIEYDLGTVYLAEARQLWIQSGVLEHARIHTLLNLARQHLRACLLNDPDHRDAILHLEYAWRITPPPREMPKSDMRGHKGSLFSTTPGLTGGGP